jgi:hypothetical protein
MRFSFALALVVLLLPVSTAVAQPSVPAAAPDFLFGRPKASVAIRGGWLFSRAGSDWYDFVTQNLTLESSDFNRPTIGTDVGIVLSDRLDAIFSLDFNRASSRSEYRDFVDNLRLPIEQQTSLRQTNVGGALKYYLTPRGYGVSRLAWVPSSVVPYVGAGGGVLWFNMVQTGDFVDFVDSSVFSDAFRSSGATPSAHVFGGVELKAWRRLFVTLDGRYLWAAGDLGPDWIDFEPIDLTGTRLSAGIKVIF